MAWQHALCLLLCVALAGHTMRARLLHASVLLGDDCLCRMPLIAERNAHPALCAVPLHSGRAAGQTAGCRAASGIGAMLQQLKCYFSLVNDTSDISMEVCHRIMAWLNVCSLEGAREGMLHVADACRACKCAPVSVYTGRCNDCASASGPPAQFRTRRQCV
jgi:hypothetical protein